MSGTGVRGALGVDREVDGTSFFGVYRCNLSIAADSSSVTIEFKVGACCGLPRTYFALCARISRAKR